MTQEEVTWFLHHPNKSLPDIRPCDTANASDTKVHWTSEEIHCIMGCRKFRNYKHILAVSKDGEWMDGGEFPMSLGSYATIPKAKCGLPLDRTVYRYLDAVHMDIAFGDCVSVGGYRFALILVDRATRYNWAFGLKTLSSSCILSALRLFRAAAGSLARCFYCDCDPKLFGMAISEYLIDNQSKVVAAPAKRQSSNGLVESHWKIMVHMARAYLTEKQMPRAFWFYAIVHAARMMNAIPGKIHGRLASPFLLVMSALGFLSSLSAIYIMKKTETSNAPNIKPTPWMALSLVVLPLPMLCWSTIHATNNTTSPTAIASTPTASLVPSIVT